MPTSSPDGLGELAALFVPDIARGCANQPRYRVPVVILRHVDCNQSVLLVVKEETRERLGELGLANTATSKGVSQV